VDVWRGRAVDKKQGSGTNTIEWVNRDRRTDTLKSEVENIALKNYNTMIEAGVAPEQARMILPQSMMTEWYWSGTLYAFARVCNLRCSPDAQIESKEVADKIAQHCENLLDEKKLLVTQQTSIDRLEMGDLFLYGSTALMSESFNEDKWYPTKTGLRSLARIFLELCEQEDWRSACIKNLSFVDIFNLKWIDFRNNWHKLKNKKNEMLNNNLVDEHEYYWGATEKWHVWDSKGNLTYSKPKMGKITTQKDWK